MVIPGDPEIDIDDVPWKGAKVLPRRWPQVDLSGGFVRLEPGTTKNSKATRFRSATWFLRTAAILCR